MGEDKLATTDQEIMKIVRQKTCRNNTLNLQPWCQTKRDTLTQISIVPTISYIMRTPIPFNNLGYIIPEAVPYVDGMPISEQIFLLTFEYLINIAQISRYLDATSAVYTSEYLTEFNMKYKNIRENFLYLLAERRINIHNITTNTNSIVTKEEHIILANFIIKGFELINLSQDLLEYNLRISRIQWLTLHTNLTIYALLLFALFAIFMFIWIIAIKYSSILNYEFPRSLFMDRWAICIPIAAIFVLYFATTQVNTILYDLLVSVILLFILLFNVISIIRKYILPNMSRILRDFKLGNTLLVSIISGVCLYCVMLPLDLIEQIRKLCRNYMYIYIYRRSS